jgi:DNA-binding response OmpR family regulator
VGVILVVDDDPGIRESVRRILTAEDHTVFTASDGYQGVLLTRREQPDVVLTDLTMPGIDGRTVCEMLREDPRTCTTRIIAMSAGLTLYESTSGLLADTILAKPFTANLLIANISLQMRKHCTERLARTVPAQPIPCVSARD